MSVTQRYVLPLYIAAAALAGAGGGFLLGRSASPGPVSAIDLFSAAQSRYSSYVFAVRGAHRTEVREDDLRAYLAFLDARASRPDAPNPSIYAFDRTLATVRLAQIAQSRKATDEAAKLMRGADGMCPLTGLRNCTANDLLYTVRERDRQTWGEPGTVGTR